MFRRHLLGALATGILAEDDDTARAALRRVDPVIRGAVRRRFERALIAAALAGPNAAPAHVMRLAALRLAGHDVPDPSDAAAVARAHAAIPAVAIPRLRVWSLGVVLALAALAAGVGWLVVTAPAAKPRTFAAALLPPSATAFSTGGTPLHDPAIERLLADQLTTLVVDAGRAHTSGEPIEPIVQPLREPPALVARAPLATAWRAMIATFADAIRDQREADHLREAVRQLTEAFGVAGLGYFLEGRIKAGAPFVQAYRVEEVRFVIAGGKPRRVLSLRRLDHLNVSYALLGMQSEDLGDPVVLLDQIDSNAASTVFPLLAPGASYQLAEVGWLASATGKALGVAVGDSVRRELIAALGDDAAVAGQVATLIAERADLIEQWRDVLERKHMAMVRTDELYLPEGLLANLDGLVPKYQRERVAAIEDELTELEAPRLTARLQELVAATVRRHEAQHGFDADRDRELRYPDALAALLGPATDGTGEPVPIVRSARAELSAYLSQVANDPITPQLALWNLGRQAFSRDRWGTGEAYVAIVVFEGLGRQLGMPVTGSPFDHGIARDRLAAFATRIAAQPGPALREAAARLWLELYGEPLTPILDR